MHMGSGLSTVADALHHDMSYQVKTSSAGPETHTLQTFLTTITPSLSKAPFCQFKTPHDYQAMRSRGGLYCSRSMDIPF